VFPLKIKISLKLFQDLGFAYDFGATVAITDIHLDWIEHPVFRSEAGSELTAAMLNGPT
jgi:hypothetical protein